MILAFALLGSIIVPAAARAAPPPPATQPAPAAIVSMVGEVNDYTRDSLKKQFAKARAAGAKTVIVHVDTFGGLVTSALEIATFIRNQTDLHTIAYVDKAISAGSMISVACDEIVMAPSAVIGDCAPIVFRTDGTLDAMPAAERAKAQSPILSDFDASADRNGYSRKLLEAMVIVERVVYYVEDPKTHERRFADATEYAKLSGQGWRDVPGVSAPLDGPETLLTLQTAEAVKVGLCKGTAASPEDLAAQRNLSIVADLSPGAGEVVIDFFNSGVVRGLALSVLVAALYIVMGAPGHGFAEAVCVLCLGILLGAPLLTGYATWWEVLIIFAGLALVAFEVFVFPGHGVSAIVGLVMVFGGLLLTFVGPDTTGPSLLPHTAGGWANLRHGVGVIAGGLAGAAVLGVILRPFLPKLPFFNRLILTTVSGNDSPLRHSAEVRPDNLWPGVGTAGVATTDLRPGGSAEFMDLASGDNRTVAVVCETGYVTAGSKLVVRESRGSRIVVRPVATIV
jgi:membrane-bound serine protease (ClpP class)